jgi:serine/threonine protein kinase
MINSQTLGHYLIEAHLGSGRYTDVYRAVDTVRKRTVALKVIKPDTLTGVQSLSRFLQQAQLAADLIHPYLAWIWETGEENGVYYLVERFVNGPSLSNILSETVAIPWEKLFPIAGQIAQGLDFAHSKGWVHGDVRLQNIIVSPDLGAVLTDFGPMLALQTIPSFSKERSSLVDAWRVAPEVRQGQPPGPSSDQYSLACVAVEALTGQTLPDLSQATPGETDQQEEFTIPTSWPASVPWNVGKALERALSSDPSARYPSVGEFIAAPDEMRSQAEQTPEARERWEAESRSRREAEEQSRRQVEEQTRLAALEQARREIQEELKQKPQEGYTESDQSVPLEPQKETTTPVPSPRTGKIRHRWKRYLIGIAVGALIVAFTGFWLNHSISGSGSFRYTATPTSPPIFPSYTTTVTTRLSSTLTPSTILTSSSTPIPTSKPTQTRTPSFTRTPYPPRAPVRERTPRQIVPSN